MNTEKIESYFGSYERKSPERIAFIQKMNLAPYLKGFPKKWVETEMNTQNQVRYREVNEKNYPKLYDVLKEECEFRGIEQPACYIDTECKSKFPLAYARAELEAIFFTPETYEKMNKDELRAAVAHEVKHLYSGVAQNNQEKRMIEKDCDRSSVESTSYQTVQSYVQKAIAIMVDRKISIPIFRKFIHRFNENFPNVIAENFWIPLDKEHPSPASRMENMRRHDQKEKGESKEIFRR